MKYKAANAFYTLGYISITLEEVKGDILWMYKKPKIKIRMLCNLECISFQHRAITIFIFLFIFSS